MDPVSGGGGGRSVWLAFSTYKAVGVASCTSTFRLVDLGYFSDYGKLLATIGNTTQSGFGAMAPAVAGNSSYLDESFLRRRRVETVSTVTQGLKVHINVTE